MQANGVLIPGRGKLRTLRAHEASLVGKSPFAASIESVLIHIGTLISLDNK